MRRIFIFALFALASIAANAQWQMLDAHTTADLRGIDNVGKGVVWASGTNGTVLRSEDGGFVWQNCAVPPDAEKLDFRGVQAFDNDMAIVMSSGKGDLSRLYKTTDGCQSWKLVLTNPDKDGFWDGITYLSDFETVFIIGDPVLGAFRVFSADVDENDKISGWGSNWNNHPILAAQDEAAFAASNSIFAYNVGDGMFSFVTGGSRSEIIHEEHGIDANPKVGMFSNWSRSPLPFHHCDSCGAFSIDAAPYDKTTKQKAVVVVGGDYRRPESDVETAAYSNDWGNTFHPSRTMPHGYRSAVAYDKAKRCWITVGPNGTDISTDDGRDWRALKPADDDAPDADKNWNALSLPFVVGPHGRIGMLRPSALRAAK